MIAGTYCSAWTTATDCVDSATAPISDRTSGGLWLTSV